MIASISIPKTVYSAYNYLLHKISNNNHTILQKNKNIVDSNYLTYINIRPKQ